MIKIKSGGFDKSNSLFADIIRTLAFSVYNTIQSGIKDANGGRLVTIDDLVFDKYGEINVNFFDDNIDSNSYRGMIKDSVTDWYIRFRRIAISAYLIILLYIGVRIMLAVGGKQQEKYKEMLTSWLQGAALLFLFPFILKYVITLNHAFVQMIETENTGGLSPSVTFNSSYSFFDNPFEDTANNRNNYLANQALTACRRSGSIVDAIVLFIMIFQFILLLIAYYKRMFMVGFLIVIFPIVMIMYPIDKIGDGKSQSFSAWIKELCVNIFTQTFHAVAFVFCMGATNEVLSHGNGHDWILAIVSISFLFKAETIIKAILGIGGTASVKSPTETFAKGAAKMAIAGQFAKSATKTATLAADGVRQIHDARAAGVRLIGRSKEERAEAKRIREETGVSRREARAQARFNTMAGFTSPQLTPEDVDTPSPEDIQDSDDAAEAIANAEDMPVDTNPDGQDALTQSGIYMLDNMGNPEMQEALEQSGVVPEGQGRKAMSTLKSGVAEYNKALLQLDPTAPDFERRRKEISEKFTAKVKVAFPGLTVEGAQKLSFALQKGLRQTKGGSARTKEGQSGFVSKPQTFDDAEKIKADFEKGRKKVNEIANFDNMRAMAKSGELVFATVDDGGAHFGKARAMERDILQAMTSTRNAEKLKKLSKRERELVARSMATIRAFSAYTQLTEEERRENAKVLRGGTSTYTRKIRTKDGTVIDTGELMFKGPEDAIQMVTAEEALAAVETLAQLDDKYDGVVGEFTQSDDSDVALPGTISEVQKVLDEAVIQFASLGEGVLCDSSGMMSDSDVAPGVTDEGAKENIRDALVAEANEQLATAKKRAEERKRIIQDRSLRTKKKQMTVIQRKADGSIVTDGDASNPQPLMETIEIDFQFYEESLTGVSIDQVLLTDKQVAAQMDSMAPSIDPSVGFDDVVAQSALGDTAAIAGRKGTRVQSSGTTLSDTVGSATLEEFLTGQQIVAIKEEREEKYQAMADSVIASQSAAIERMDAPKVNGMTREEFVQKAISDNQQGRRKIEEAIAQVTSTAVAAATTGAMAIGLNTGQSPLMEFAAGTLAGQKLISGDLLKGIKKTIKVKDESGTVKEITLDAESLAGLAPYMAGGGDRITDADGHAIKNALNAVLNFMDRFDETQVYDITQVRSEANSTPVAKVNTAILRDIEVELSKDKVVEQAKVDDENEERLNVMAEKKIGKFYDALGNQRNNS